MYHFSEQHEGIGQLFPLVVFVPNMNMLKWHIKLTQNRGGERV